MLSRLRAFLSGLGGGREAAPAPAAAEPVVYKDFVIRPAPTRAGGQFQTAGTIEKDVGGEKRLYRLIRVDKHATHEEAVTFTVMKARQVIDEQGERMFSG